MCLEERAGDLVHYVPQAFQMQISTFPMKNTAWKQWFAPSDMAKRLFRNKAWPVNKTYITEFHMKRNKEKLNLTAFSSRKTIAMILFPIWPIDTFHPKAILIFYLQIILKVAYFLGLDVEDVFYFPYPCQIFQTDKVMEHDLDSTCLLRTQLTKIIHRFPASFDDQKIVIHVSMSNFSPLTRL